MFKEGIDGKSHQMLHSNIIGKDERFWPLITEDAQWLRVVRAILGEDCLLSSSTTRWTQSGCSEQYFHTDDALYGRELFPRPLRKQLSCVAAVALEDFTVGNGATKLFPCSHTWEQDPNSQEVWEASGGVRPVAGLTDRKAVEGLYPRANLHLERWAEQTKGARPIQAVMPAGSVLIWVGGVWHGGGAYKDKPEPGGPPLADRAAVLFNMCRGLLRTQENSMIQLPHSRVARMPVDAQRLVGYAMMESGLGHADGGFGARLLGKGGRALEKWQIKAFLKSGGLKL